MVMGMDGCFTGRALEKALKILVFVDLKYITTLTGYGYNFIGVLFQYFSHLIYSFFVSLEGEE
jgi:hypothetical protein